MAKPEKTHIMAAVMPQIVGGAVPKGAPKKATTKT